MRAAGSIFARKPTRSGGLSSCCSPSAISASRFFATVAASTTLQDAGASAWVAMLRRLRLKMRGGVLSRLGESEAIGLRDKITNGKKRNPKY